MIPKRFTIATRESPLAMWQALHIQARLRAQYPDSQVELLSMTTKGDQILNKTLSKVGGKGLFVKELEAALLDGRADLAVHSLKDVPMVLPEGFDLVAVTERADPRDALVSNRYASLEEMPAGAVVGTSSLRRELMLRREYPHLVVKSVRGNVGTRLRKLDSGEFDALLMAGIGLVRLGLDERVRQWISLEKSVPAPGQGALGIEISAGRPELAQALAFLNDEKTRAIVTAERAVSRALGGSCQIPLAANAVIDNGVMTLNALVGDHSTGETVFAQTQCDAARPEQAAQEVLAQLRGQGAEEILQRVLSRNSA